MNNHVLEPLSFSESVSVDNYKAAMTGALASADSLADKVVTAAVSAATAYGAVIVLVAPKDSQAPWQAVIPFAFLALAVGLALYTQSAGISIAETDSVDVVRERIQSTITWKRWWGRGALAALVVGLIAAGYVIYQYYGPSADDPSPSRVTLYLTPAGTTTVSIVCKTPNKATLTGKVKDIANLSEPRVSLEVNKRQCPSGAGGVLLPQRAIAATKFVPRP